jgi:hypothetical protein
MAWYDFITDRTGAIGSLIKHQAARVNRDKIVSNLLIKMPPPKETKIILEDGSIIWFDCAEQVDHVFPSKVTEFPIEDGASVSDHIVNGNATFSITGIFSDARLRKPDAQGNATAPLQPTQTETYQSLLKLRNDRRSFSLLTPLDTYTNIVLKNLGMPRDKGDALSVKMEFEQIRRATSGTTTVSIVSNSGGGKTVDVKKPVPSSVPSTAPETKLGTPPVDNTTYAKDFKDKAIRLFKGVTGR